MRVPPLAICNASALLSDGIHENCRIRCAGGKIVEILVGSTVAAFGPDAVDAHGGILVPGFIDLHAHGVRGSLAGRGREDLEAMCRELPRFGVTGFLPSVCTMGSGEEDIRLLRGLSCAKSCGTAILGILLEGHFLALNGAIPALPNYGGVEMVHRLIEACAPHRAVFAVSPEVAGICGLLPAMTASGAPAFITHTAADCSQTERAIAAGARHATHFYDVFPYPGERDPGVRACGAVESILADPAVSVDFILDGEHVDPAAVRMALAAKGPGKVCLITDANINAGLPPGRYEGLGGYHVDVASEGGPARCAEDGPLPGALSGSGLTMDGAVRNAVRLLKIGLPQAARMASANPAAVLGLSASKGCIAQGFDADLALLDGELKVEMCWVGGACRYDRRAERREDGD